MSNLKKNLGLCMLGIGVFSLVGCGTPNKATIDKKELNNVEVSETLPLGIIVTLKEGDQELMIINRGVLADVEDTHLLFDYSACLYPNGADVNTIYYFNQENIDKVLFEGYKNEDEEKFQRLLKEWKKEKGKIYEKGIVF